MDENTYQIFTEGLLCQNTFSRARTSRRTTHDPHSACALGCQSLNSEHPRWWGEQAVTTWDLDTVSEASLGSQQDWHSYNTADHHGACRQLDPKIITTQPKFDLLLFPIWTVISGANDWASQGTLTHSLQDILTKSPLWKGWTLQYLLGLFYDQVKVSHLPCPTTSASFLFLNLSSTPGPLLLYLLVYPHYTITAWGQKCRLSWPLL